MQVPLSQDELSVINLFRMCTGSHFEEIRAHGLKIFEDPQYFCLTAIDVLNEYEKATAEAYIQAYRARGELEYIARCPAVWNLEFCDLPTAADFTRKVHASFVLA